MAVCKIMCCIFRTSPIAIHRPIGGQPAVSRGGCSSPTPANRPRPCSTGRHAPPPPPKKGALPKQENKPALGRGPREESREHVRRQPMMLALQHIWRSVGQVIRPADSFGIVLTLLLLNYLAITIEHTAPWVRVI